MTAPPPKRQAAAMRGAQQPQAEMAAKDEELKMAAKGEELQKPVAVTSVQSWHAGNVIGADECVCER